MAPIDFRHYRFLRQEPPQMALIPFEEDADPPPLENRYRVPAALCAIAALGLVVVLALAS